jgi:ribose 5-phosphate isomerase A
MGPPVEIAIDGADVVDPIGRAIKGGGGALVREAVVDCSAGRFLVVVDAPKVVASLDAWGSLPLAVVPFAFGYLRIALADLTPTRRPGRSDDGLAIVDVHPPAGVDWDALEVRLRAVPGVVQTGVFRVRLEDVLVGHPDGSVTGPSGL